MLDKIHHQVIAQGRVKAEDASKALWAQVQKGDQSLNPIVPKLASNSHGPVTYSKLLKTKQEEEALIAAKAQKAKVLKGNRLQASS